VREVPQQNRFHEILDVAADDRQLLVIVPGLRSRTRTGSLVRAVQTPALQPAKIDG